MRTPTVAIVLLLNSSTMAALDAALVFETIPVKALVDATQADAESATTAAESTVNTATESSDNSLAESTDNEKEEESEDSDDSTSESEDEDGEDNTDALTNLVEKSEVKDDVFPGNRRRLRANKERK